ncbi:hypothetical protein K440DRAFT_610836 [Wilcoxina mikolae CBS 423.85]|nr:hypothetical protein K440DRAFT_610836 [Wilcoxina mikolae CBS 423.85]
MFLNLTTSPIPIHIHPSPWYLCFCFFVCVRVEALKANRMQYHTQKGWKKLGKNRVMLCISPPMESSKELYV